jgi:hypothetical protein
MPFPFEAPFDDVLKDIDRYVDEVFKSLESGFMTMPKGPGFIEYQTFELGYENLKRVTGGFRSLLPDRVLATVHGVTSALRVSRHRTIGAKTTPTSVARRHGSSGRRPRPKRCVRHASRESPVYRMSHRAFQPSSLVASASATACSLARSTWS